MRCQAQHLQTGMIVGSGETVVSVWSGANTPTGYVNVALQKGDKRRTSLWGKYTMVWVKEPETVPYTKPLVPELANPWNNVGVPNAHNYDPVARNAHKAEQELAAWVSKFAAYDTSLEDMLATAKLYYNSIGDKENEN